MTDQKLVDELEKALRDEAYDGGFGYMGDEQFTAYVRTLAETAAEVFEKALTPTDDEREDMIAFLLRDHNFEESPWGRTYTDAEIAAALRRSEVPEPSTEVDETAARYQPCHFDTSGMYERTWCHTHGADHLMPSGDVYVQGHRLPDGHTYTGPMSVDDLPQGEPSDAQVDAAGELLYGISWGTDIADPDLVRAALRAAGVRGAR
ncbi:hypothetical protein ABY45_14605 [Microbacterium maritypicum]|uniref:hypothetical protein n=1 Tax=Microbacterium maritypicum TaxID=33918 RepID=UPI003D6EDF8F